MAEAAEVEICEPIRTYDNVFTVAENPPNWFQGTIPISPRSTRVIQNINFDRYLYRTEVPVLPRRQIVGTVPKTIVCHDMMNGYLLDKYCLPVPNGNGYVFSKWQNIDMFIYFSHHFITIPPLAWINVAHKNGVQVLGTIITEWDEGAELCKRFLSSQEEIDRFVDALVKITVACKLDGWLINIENHIPAENICLLVHFVKTLTRSVHGVLSNGVVLWYDSVVRTGRLEWQNELNHLNGCFFEACDGIFLNYNTTKEHMERSLQYSPRRRIDIYVGIDVFGRNTPYTAGVDCFKFVKMARTYGLSIAFFAPGWTYEQTTLHPINTFFQRYLNKDNNFWAAMWPYLYTHPVNKEFHTEFDLGSSERHYDLQSQELQLVNNSCGFRTVLNNGHMIYQVLKDPYVTNAFTWHHLIAIDLLLEEPHWFVLEMVNVNPNDRARHHFNAMFVIQRENEQQNNIICAVKRSVSRLNIFRSKRYYFLSFVKPVCLMHVYVQLPLDTNLALGGITLVKAKDHIFDRPAVIH